MRSAHVSEEIAIQRLGRGNLVAAVTSLVLLAVLLPLEAIAQSALGARAPESLPVYEVVKAGTTSAEAALLAEKLGLQSRDILSRGGMINFVDPARYLRVPTAARTESRLLDEAIAATRNKDPSRTITPTVLNAREAGELQVVAEDWVMARTEAAFKAAKLEPQFGRASVGHNVISLYSIDGKRSVMRESVPIDTEVTFKFTTPDGFPIYGPGAEVQVTYDAGGHVSRLLYAARRLKPVGHVKIIPQAEANERIARHFPANAKITSRLVYFAPPLANADGESRVTTLIPWYAYYATRQVVVSATGAASQVRSKIGFMPATPDERFVPTARLAVSGGTQVHGLVDVHGGRAPYQYVWSGSNPASQRSRADISYRPELRAARPFLESPDFRLHRNETLSVTVIDANGISVIDSQTVPVEVTPVMPQDRGVSMPSYGSENPGDPLHWTAARIAWNKEMATPGAGATLSFNWLGDDAWPGDFIRPTPAATLVTTPWVYGDADFANWGVDTADIVLDNADGWTDGTVLMQPGAPDTDYSTASISSPVSAQTVNVNGHGFGTPASYAVNYNGSWGPVGPNDTLEWLLLDDCDMLDALGASNLNVAQRWGPAFGGLHVLTGFASLGYGDGPFEGGVADDLLGVHGPAQTIVQSWFNSAAATGAGTAAAMGPALEVAPGMFVCDLDDYFWGKGTVGPTLVPSSYPAAQMAFWYLTSTSAIQYLF
jgi:hypothetical protein